MMEYLVFLFMLLGQKQKKNNVVKSDGTLVFHLTVPCCKFDV